MTRDSLTLTESTVTRVTSVVTRSLLVPRVTSSFFCDTPLFYWQYVLSAEYQQSLSEAESVTLVQQHRSVCGTLYWRYNTDRVHCTTVVTVLVHSTVPQYLCAGTFCAAACCTRCMLTSSVTWYLTVWYRTVTYHLPAAPVQCTSAAGYPLRYFEN